MDNTKKLTVEDMHNSPMIIKNLFKLTVGNQYQYQQKHNYHSKYVQQVYKETGIQFANRGLIKKL